MLYNIGTEVLKTAVLLTIKSASTHFVGSKLLVQTYHARCHGRASSKLPFHLSVNAQLRTTMYGDLGRKSRQLSM